MSPAAGMAGSAPTRPESLRPALADYTPQELPGVEARTADGLADPSMICLPEVRAVSPWSYDVVLIDALLAAGMTPGQRIFHFRSLRGYSQGDLVGRMRLVVERYRRCRGGPSTDFAVGKRFTHARPVQPPSARRSAGCRGRGPWRRTGPVFPVGRGPWPAEARYGQLAGGWLLGEYRKDREITDRGRRFDPDAAANAAKLDAADALGALADEAGLTLIQMAIAFTVEHPAVTSTIIGPRTMEHLEGYLAADGVTLSTEVLDRIDQIVPPAATINVADNMWQYGTPALSATARRRPLKH